MSKSISFSLISYFNVLFSPAMQQSPAHRKFTGLETSWGGFLFFYHHQISLLPAEALNDLLFNADVLPRCSIGLLRFRSRIYGFQLCLSNSSCNFTIRFSLEDFFNPPLFFSFWDSCDMGFVGGWWLSNENELLSTLIMNETSNNKWWPALSSTGDKISFSILFTFVGGETGKDWKGDQRLSVPSLSS